MRQQRCGDQEKEGRNANEVEVEASGAITREPANQVAEGSKTGVVERPRGRGRGG